MTNLAKGALTDSVTTTTPAKQDSAPVQAVTSTGVMLTVDRYNELVSYEQAMKSVSNGPWQMVAMTAKPRYKLFKQTGESLGCVECTFLEEAEARRVVAALNAAPHWHQCALHAEGVVTLFAEAYPRAGLTLDMDKASLLHAAREVIAKAKGE